MADETGMLRQVTTLAERIGDLHAREIERTLDGLLDFCGHAAVLDLYRRLCRHYHGIDPVAAASYATAYRAMYDEGQPG